MINYIPRRFTVIRDKELCINCGCCVRQCSNECHFFDEDGKTVLVNSKNCVACHRCVDLCPTGALRIEELDTFLSAGNLPSGRNGFGSSFRYG